MIYPLGWRVRVGAGAVAIRYEHRKLEWEEIEGHPFGFDGWAKGYFELLIEPVEEAFDAIVVVVDHAKMFRDPATTTRVVDLATGREMMFTDGVAKRHMETL